MFVRVTVLHKHEESHQPMGVFQAACRLRDRGRMKPADELRHDEILRWFNLHLPIPGRFSRSHRRHAACKAICWFRKQAVDHIGMLRNLATLLERHGLATRTVHTAKPGYVVYEDDHQVVAVPFRDTIAPRVSD